MATSHFTYHFTDDVVQVQTSLGVWHQYFVFLLDGFPIQSVHVFQVEAITESTPNFIIDLCPFFGIVYMGYHIFQINGISQICFSSREIAYEDLSSFREDGFLAAWSNAERCSFGYGFFLLCFQVECLGIASATIIYFLSIREEITVHTSWQWQLDDASENTICIHLYNSLFLFILFGRICFTVRRKQRRRSILGKHRHINTVHTVVGMVPFQLSVSRIEIAC